MSAVLVTGFGPFGNTPVNPAKFVAEALDGEVIAGIPVTGRIVPNVFWESITAAVAAVDEVGADLIVMLGEYGGRSMITVERVAQNINDSARYGLADNAGRVLDGEPTVPGGPVAYLATAPVKAMVLGMRRAGVPADISDAAGTFGCNHLMYGMLHHLAATGSPARAAWLHLPALPEVAALDRNLGMPSMSVDTAVTGVAAAIEAAVTHAVDVEQPVASRLLV